MMDDLTETDRIERDLAATRARMDGRLDELQGHFTPRQMLNDAFAYFRGGDGADFTKDLVTRARANPLPVALTGIGIAWLMASGRTSIAAPQKSYDPAAGSNDAFGRLGDSAGERGVALTEGTKDMANSTRNALSSVTSNPFALGGIAALVGLLAGSLLPLSDEERNAIGSTAGKLRTAGRDLAQDIVDRGGQVAADTLEAIRGSAEAHGLSADRPVGELLGDAKSGELLDNVKQIAGETLQAGRDSVQTHLAGSDAGAPD